MTATITDFIATPKDPAAREEHFSNLVAGSLELLAEELAKGVSTNFLKLLQFNSKFHRYSANNQLLIWLQRRDAGRVAGYKTWANLGRQVKHGTKAIWIYAPMWGRKETDAITGEEGRRIVGFKLSPVFADVDLEDIETNPLPALWTPLPDDCQELVGEIILRCEQDGITVKERKLASGTMGMASNDTIILSTVIKDSRTKLGVLLHEAAHIYAEHSSQHGEKKKEQRELEAEASAFVMMQRLGIDWPFSSDYLTSWEATPDTLRDSLQVITKITRQLSRLVEDVNETA